MQRIALFKSRMHLEYDKVINLDLKGMVSLRSFLCAVLRFIALLFIPLDSSMKPDMIVKIKITNFAAPGFMSCIQGCSNWIERC